jgi:GxxExxY protein
MNHDDMEQLPRKVIASAFTVGNVLGQGFLEKVYENALAHELRKGGVSVRQQHPIRIHYDGVVVGDYLADILVEEALVIELKAVKALDDVHLAQCLNYLKASGLRLCLLMNFGKTKVEVRRVVNNY